VVQRREGSAQEEDGRSEAVKVSPNGRTNLASTSRIEGAMKTKSKLPRIRPCGECGLDRLIVAHGLCDACRQHEVRAQELHALNHPTFGRKEQQESVIALLGRLTKLLEKSRECRSRIEGLYARTLSRSSGSCRRRALR